MPRGQIIPSVEEIQAKLEGRPGVATHAQVNDQELEALEAQVKVLEKITEKKKRRTASELRAAMDILMEKYDFSPAEELIKLALEKREGGDFDGMYELDASGQRSLRVSILQELMGYVQPKLKSVEVTGEVKHSHEVHIIRWGDDGQVRKESLTNPGNRLAIPVEATVTREAVES